jgi:hypothetical protein
VRRLYICTRFFKRKFGAVKLLVCKSSGTDVLNFEIDIEAGLDRGTEKLHQLRLAGTAWTEDYETFGPAHRLKDPVAIIKVRLLEIHSKLVGDIDDLSLEFVRDQIFP